MIIRVPNTVGAIFGLIQIALILMYPREEKVETDGEPDVENDLDMDA